MMTLGRTFWKALRRYEPRPHIAITNDGPISARFWRRVTNRRVPSGEYHYESGPWGKLLFRKANVVRATPIREEARGRWGSPAYLFARITGGRPMRLVKRNARWNYVRHPFSGKKIRLHPYHLYRDRLGREWMAVSAWDRDRIEPELLDYAFDTFEGGDG